MTVKEAIDELKYSRDMCYFDPSTGETGEPYDEDCERMAQALDIAIKALEIEPVGDCISRQAAINFIKDHSYPVRYDRTSIEQGMTLTGIEQALNEVPTVQPVQKTGRWIDGYKRQSCSVCKYRGMRSWNFCPNCGAKMEQEG